LARGQIVIPNHLVAVGQQPFREVASDEPRATGDETAQFAFLESLRCYEGVKEHPGILATKTAMLLRFRRPVSLLLILGLLGFLIARGVVPAMTAIASDFPNYFTASKIVADKGDVTRLYDDAWFQSQIRRYRVGDRFAGKFSPFPPATALLLLPLTRLQPLDALRVLTCISLACLLASVIILAKTLEWNAVETGVFVLLSGYAVLNGLRDGQPYIIMSMSCILGYYARLRGRPWLAGLCFGLFVPIKYFPAVFFVYFACRREWKIVLAGAATALVIALLGIVVLGWKVHEEFLATVLGNHLIGVLSMQDPFTASFQSFDSLFRRLFVFDVLNNPRPFFTSGPLHILSVIVTKAGLLAAAAATLVRLERSRSADAAAASLGIIGVLGMLLAPATASYHFVLLWLPVGLLAAYFIRERANALAAWIIFMYALIGFFPYKFTMSLDGRGGLSVLAYPRLFLLLAILLVCLSAIWCRAAPDAGPASVEPAAAAVR
jgi:hypothetical protein